MLAQRAFAVLTFTALVGAPESVESQTLDELVGAGRFEEAVILVGNASPEEALAAARLMFNAAYANGQQRGDFDYAIRGFASAKRLVSIGDPFHEQLSFWHGFAVYNAAIDAQAAQTVETAQLTLPMFQEARGLFASAGAYPAAVNVNMSQLSAATDTYIEIQNAIIRRAR
jgi:hypothetical protein